MSTQDKIELLFCWLAPVALILAQRKFDAWARPRFQRYAYRPWVWIMGAFVSALCALAWRRLGTLVGDHDAFMWWLSVVATVGFLAATTVEIAMAGLVFWISISPCDETLTIRDDGNPYRSPCE